MTALAATLLCALSGALFDIAEIPVDDPQATCLMVEGASGHTDLAVLTGNRLVRYPSAEPDQGHMLRLDEGTSAFDIADLDADGIPELVFVQGAAIKRLAYGGEAGAAETLFELETLFSAASTPFAQVLVTTYEEEQVLALPGWEAFELRRLDGSLAACFPVGRDAPFSMAFGRPFLAREVDPPQVAGPGGLEFAISAVSAHRPTLPEDLADKAEPVGSAYRYGTQRQAREALNQPSNLWPWFPLSPEGVSHDRALHAAEGNRVTVVRVQSERTTFRGGETHVGPPRRYPGQILTPAGVFPDFDGDGLTDLLLWDTPEPAPSVGTLTRALATRNWPLRMTVHLYDAEHRRYAAKPAAVLQLRPPLTWFLERLGWPPIRHIALADFDGDGRTDLGCSAEPKTYSVWCWGEDGFDDAPTFSRDFGEEVSEIAFQSDLNGNGGTSLGLRADSVIYVLRAQPRKPRS